MTTPNTPAQSAQIIGGTLTLDSNATINTQLGGLLGSSPYQYSLSLDDTLTAASVDLSLHNQLSVRGNMSVEGDILLNNLSLKDRLDRIEEQLGILQHRPDWEQRVEELKAIGDQYRAMVTRLDEKQRIWDIMCGDKDV